MTALPASFLLLFIFFTIGSATTRKITKSPAFESVRSKQEENWRRRAIDILWAERRRWGHTPIVRIPLAGFPNVDILFKNESTTPTGSLKHRFAWSLMLWGVLEGHIKSNTHLVESSSGNTAAGEAYFCRLLNLSFTAVVSKGIEKEKAAHLEEYGAKLVRVDADQRRPVSKRLGAKPNHWLVDQHANSEKAIDSFENGNFSFESANLFHELYKQLHFKAPDYVIHGLGTGGTITSIGRYVHRYNLPTRVVGADSEFSLLYDYVKSGAFTSEKEGGHSQWKGPGVAGIGFGYQHEAIHFGTSSSLLRSVIDEVVKLPDIVSTAGSRVLTGLKTNTGRTLSGGPSTALNFLVALAYAHRHNGTPARHTTIASLICDQIVHYRSTVLDDKWVAKSFKDGLPRVHCWENAIKTVIAKGGDFVKLGKNC